MKRATLFRLLVMAAAVGSGCSEGGLTSGGSGADTDMAAAVFPGDAAVPPDQADAGPANLCGDHDPGCQEFNLGPEFNKPFALSGDPQPDPAAASDRVLRDPDGWLVLEPVQGNSIWVVEDKDATVSKLDPRAMKEVARYRTVTCFSRPSGSRLQCDGVNGCCAVDSQPQWLNRKAKMADGPAQQVQLQNNSPYPASVDINGDVFVANPAGQPSVTKIAGDSARCKDRNRNGRIDTSTDVNQDGRIDPNDPKEFLDLDDECILWTANHGPPDSRGNPLGLGLGSVSGGPSDAFTGSSASSTIYRVDGATGKVRDEWQLSAECQPLGLTVDAQGFGWANSMGHLCYFDTGKSGKVGQVRGGTDGAIRLDRDQNIWLGGGVARYAPDRSKGFASLDSGYFTWVSGLRGYGLAADSRSVRQYFVWSANGNMLMRIPASEIPPPKGIGDTVVVDPQWPKIDVC